MSTIADILNKLSAEDRKTLESTLASRSSAFVHVGHSPVYSRTYADGRQQIRSTGIDNPNTLKISYNRSIGRRRISIGMNRQKDGTYTVNSLGAPGSGIMWLKDGRLAIVLNDTFNDGEKNFINAWSKSKYTEPPTVSTKATSTAPTADASVDETPDESADESATETPTETPKTPAKGGSNAKVLADAKEMVSAGLYPNVAAAVQAHNKGEW